MALPYQKHIRCSELAIVVMQSKCKGSIYLSDTWKATDILQISYLGSAYLSLQLVRHILFDALRGDSVLLMLLFWCLYEANSFLFLFKFLLNNFTQKCASDVRLKYPPPPWTELNLYD